MIASRDELDLILAALCHKAADLGAQGYHEESRDYSDLAARVMTYLDTTAQVQQPTRLGRALGWLIRAA
jgi:hypothetical protein